LAGGFGSGLDAAIGKALDAIGEKFGTEL
jgi:hypothetical protein